MGLLNPPQAFRNTLNTHRRGSRAQQPSHLNVLPGTLYYVVDEGTLEQALTTGWVTYIGAGGSSFNLVNYSYSVNTAFPPSTNQVRFNGLHPYTGVNKIFFDNQSADNQDLHIIMLRILPASTIYIQKKNDHKQAAVFTVTAPPINHTSWIELNVEHVSHTATPIGGGQTVLIQSIIGEIGPL